MSVRTGGSFRFTGRGKVRVAHESTDALEVMVRRLRTLGADDDEVTAFREVWNDGDEKNWLVTKSRLLTMSDTKLRGLLVAAREEHTFHTTPEPAGDPAEELAELRRANNGNPLNIADTKAWVGTDAARARAALAAERDETHPRASLIAYLEPLG